MDILCTKEELAILKWLHSRVKEFSDGTPLAGDSYFVSPEPMKKELALSDEQFKRATSYLGSMKLLQINKHGDVSLSANGANTYRHAAPKEDWDTSNENEDMGRPIAFGR